MVFSKTVISIAAISCSFRNPRKIEILQRRGRVPLHTFDTSNWIFFKGNSGQSFLFGFSRYSYEFNSRFQYFWIMWTQRNLTKFYQQKMTSWIRILLECFTIIFLCTTSFENWEVCAALLENWMEPCSIWVSSPQSLTCFLRNRTIRTLFCSSIIYHPKRKVILNGITLLVFFSLWSNEGFYFFKNKLELNSIETKIYAKYSLGAPISHIWKESKPLDIQVFVQQSCQLDKNWNWHSTAHDHKYNDVIGSPRVWKHGCRAMILPLSSRNMVMIIPWRQQGGHVSRHGCLGHCMIITFSLIHTMIM